jgi:hypothetical protein
MTIWATIAGLAVASAAIKAAGPVALGGRELPPALTDAIAVLAPALLAALVVTETFAGEGRTLVLDARAAGLGAAGVSVAVRAPLLVTVAVAALAAALVRAVGG